MVLPGLTQFAVTGPFAELKSRQMQITLSVTGSRNLELPVIGLMKIMLGVNEK